MECRQSLRSDDAHEHGSYLNRHFRDHRRGKSSDPGAQADRPRASTSGGPNSSLIGYIEVAKRYFSCPHVSHICPHVNESCPHRCIFEPRTVADVNLKAEKRDTSDLRVDQVQPLIPYFVGFLERSVSLVDRTTPEIIFSSKRRPAGRLIADRNPSGTDRTSAAPTRPTCASGRL
jgi:hypothetical protein